MSIDVTAPSLAAIPTLDDLAASTLLATTDEPVLLYFTASWCGPCREFGPRLDAFAAAHPDAGRIVRIDCDAAPETAARFAVQAYPTLTMVRGGRQLWLRAGGLSDDELIRLVPALATAAAAVPAADDGAPEDAASTLPRRVRIPALDDPRITVWRGPERVPAGTVIELAAGETLRVALRSDRRQNPSRPTEQLARFDDGAIGAVGIAGSDLGAHDIDALAALRGLTALDVSAGRGLPQAFVDGLPRLRNLRFLFVDAPGTDLDALRRVVPDVMVNFDWTSPELASRLPAADVAPAAPTAELAPVRLGDAPGDGRARIVLRAHPADPVPAEVRAALAALTDIDTGEAVDADDPDVAAHFRLSAASELLLQSGPTLRARRDVCGPHHIAELAELADVASPLAFAPGSRDARARTLELALPDGADAQLAPPGTAAPDWAPLSGAAHDAHVPAGWRLVVRAGARLIPQLPGAEIDELIVEVGDGDRLDGLGEWGRLRDATIVFTGDDTAALADLASVRALERLTIWGEVDEAALERLRRALPMTAINGDWTAAA